jgi:hypothetical protein
MKNAALILLFQAYCRSGSIVTLAFQDTDMNITLRCRDSGYTIKKQIKEHLELIDELYNTTFLTDVSHHVLMNEIDLDDHISTCHSRYGKPAIDVDKQLAYLNKHHGISSEKYVDLTSFITIGK